MKIKLSLIFLFIISLFIYGNNIQTSNISIVEKNTTQNTIKIKFDLSWENSWRDNENWDAAWVFIKYRVSGGAWQHATLKTTGNYVPSGTTVTVGETDAKGKGAFIYRSALGGGDISLNGVKLVWDYGTDGVADDAVIDIRVFAIEMVYIPQSSYWLGDGWVGGTFRIVASNTPAQITDQPIIVKCDGTLPDAGDTQLKDYGILVDGDNGIDKDGTTEVDNPDFPTGYKAFYCMKYEITQGQYVDFLNTITRVQQNRRTQTNLAVGVTSVAGRYVMYNQASMYYRNGIRCDGTIHSSNPITFYCDYDGDDVGNESNDGQWIACNYLNWMDGCAYADWAGLRPMTELEFEKVCRGPNSSVSGEFAWGTNSTYSSDYSWTNLGESNEISTDASTSVGNSLFMSTSGNINGPMRVGAFATDLSDRITSGSSYYGVMEMSGNVLELPVTLGNSTGRNFTGLHGDGILSSNGNANVSNWPGLISGEVTGGTGSGIRGGDWSNSPAPLGIVSDRYYATSARTNRGKSNGFRGCRSVE